MKPLLSSIVLVETDHQYRTLSMHKKLLMNNFPILGAFDHAQDLVSKIGSLKPDVLVLSVDFLDAQTLDELTKLHKWSPLPILVSAQQHAPEVLRTVVAAGVNSYVVDDIKPERLPVIVDIAVERFKQLNSLSMALEETKERLEERKLVEKAKGIIMQQKQLSEAEAYSQMRKSAMNQGQSMGKLAQQVIHVFELLE